MKRPIVVSDWPPSDDELAKREEKIKQAAIDSVNRAWAKADAALSRGEDGGTGK